MKTARIIGETRARFSRHRRIFGRGIFARRIRSCTAPASHRYQVKVRIASSFSSSSNHVSAAPRSLYLSIGCGRNDIPRDVHAQYDAKSEDRTYQSRDSRFNLFADREYAGLPEG